MLLHYSLLDLSTTKAQMNLLLVSLANNGKHTISDGKQAKTRQNTNGDDFRDFIHIDFS